VRAILTRSASYWTLNENRLRLALDVFQASVPMSGRSAVPNQSDGE